ncbi:multicopper oxidase domain-containing protein [Kocuria sabuli]|uniref:multicopper oxidase domain-containing protein n=1 Tax=Kocuria sabuli TaxID=3071448 RepID=UPI0034D5BD39
MPTTESPLPREQPDSPPDVTPGPETDGTAPTTVHYDVVALQMTIYYNREGDHDHNGMLFALCDNLPILRYIRALAQVGQRRGPSDGKEDVDLGKLYKEACDRAKIIKVDLPMTPAQAMQPHPLVRPLVLRARRGQQVTVTLHNEIKDRAVGLHLVAGGYDVTTSDGSHVGANPSNLAPFGGKREYTWTCDHEGVFPFHDGGNYSGAEDGTNVHGLFGALVVEPPGTTWRDPITGIASHGEDGTGDFQQLDGLYLDVIPPGMNPSKDEESTTTLADHKWRAPKERACFEEEAHREFVVFFHDEPEYVPAHDALETSPCTAHDHGGGHGGGGHGGGHEELPIMPISYRAEPMINRERTMWRWMRTGHVLERPVLNEEQHHSSWMFGDPVTPILRAYIGDPVRIRLVHTAVKETHVFHLHLYEWHAVAQDPDSPRIDAISISPQTGHTIDPLWGAGNRHQVAGDVIFHCHLYPHFHEGMWGMFRTFETRQDGGDGDVLASEDPVYAGRRIGRYPDGTRIERLLPLPDRQPPPSPTPEQPGYPLYIPGTPQQKSPRPPWPDREFTEEERSCNEKDRHASELPCGVTSLRAADMPADFDYRPVPTSLEREAFNALPVPGELFTRNRLAGQQAQEWKKPETLFAENISTQVCHDIVVARRRIDYNSHGWHDDDGHLYYLAAEGDPADRPGPLEPLFLRAQHGQIVNLTMRNDTPEVIEETEFDHAFPPCPALPWEGECAPHVHMVKFDPICADGASVGWNYMSGARHGRKMVYRWWADQEYGTIFFHDHLFANYRQKHGLFGALLVEPAGSRFLRHIEADHDIVTGVQALIQRHPKDIRQPRWFREFCIGIGDFIPMWDRHNRALNPPAQPGGHGDQGVMGLNYRNAPLRERGGDPANWFNSRVQGDPDTTIFTAYANDPVWIRLLQGSHEESHSFQIHALRWLRFREQVDSIIRNQQTTGLAEAFTFINQAPLHRGDYLYKLSGADDMWLGCWGLIRALDKPPAELPPDLVTLENTHTPRHATEETATSADVTATPGPPPKERLFRVRARLANLRYRDDIIDPYALIYELVDTFDEPCPDPTTPEDLEPLVLWCQEGDQVVVELQNCLSVAPSAGLRVEPFAPEVPVERADRPVSQQVSLHADLVTYDVTQHDGANVGFNPPQTVPPGQTRKYRWDTTRPAGSNEPLGPVLLQDMADVRHHRHHGLVGALVVLPNDATPHPVATTPDLEVEQWHGPHVTVTRKGTELPAEEQVTEQIVLLMQDGLRLFLNNNGKPGFPLPDPPEEVGEAEKEDQGQKGFNYRAEPIGPIFDPRGSDYSLHKEPATPVWEVPAGRKVRFHLVGALDKPRAYSFTIHGVTWPEHRFRSDAGAQTASMVSAESAISSGSARTFEFTPTHEGDHAYRSGVLKWAVPQGMWGILRVGPTVGTDGHKTSTSTDHPESQ